MKLNITKKMEETWQSLCIHGVSPNKRSFCIFGHAPQLDVSRRHVFINNAMDISKVLRDEAFEIIDAFGFLELLGQYGDARLVGSVALDLVVKPDIDFHLFITKSDVVNVAESIKSSLIADERIRDIRVSDHLEKESLKIGIDCLPGRSAEWGIDIWITSDVDTTGFEETDRIRSLLNEDNRKTILELKRVFWRKGQLHDSMSSVIYRAVLEDGVSNLGEFHKYLEEKFDAG